MKHDDGQPEQPSSPAGRRCGRTCAAVTVAVIAAALLILVLGLTVLRPKQAITTVNSAKIDGVKAGFDYTNLGLALNVTVLLNISTTNPNRARFRYGDGTAELYYRGAQVGEAAVPAGEIGPGETIETVVRLTVLADRLVSSAAVLADVVSGSLTVTTRTRISGRVTVLGFVNRHMVMYTTCDIDVNIASRSATNSNCKSRTKL